MWGRVTAALVAAALVAPQACAESVAEFYRGREVTLIIGAPAGGGYDGLARLLARHIGRHIAGKPEITVQHMPGARGLRAANHLYHLAPKDGTTIALLARNVPLLGMLGGSPHVQFDARKLTWLGSASSFANDAFVLIVRKDAPAKTIDDARRVGGAALVLGGTAESATSNDVPIILRDTIGLNVRKVVAFPDTPALHLAMERSEVHGRTTDFSTLKAAKPEWFRPESRYHVLCQFARATRHPEFSNVPTARELARNEQARALIELTEIPYRLARPFAAPPEIPAERAQALQRAFLAALADPDYLAEAARLNIDVSPLGADGVMAEFDRIQSAPPQFVDYLRKLFTESRS